METPALVIGDGRNTLTLEHVAGPGYGRLTATAVGPDLTARHTFHDLQGVADFRELDALFQGLGADWRGFEGERSWVSLDADFSIICVHDGLRRVRMRVAMRDHLHGWEIELPIDVELGRLEQLKQDSQVFFSVQS